METHEDWLASLNAKRARIDDLAAEITELAGHLNAANYKFLQLIAEFDKRKGWADGATHSCAHWLNWKCGIDIGAAREKVRVAHALDGLPKIAEAMQKGQLSYSKARALTRIACPNTEEYLLMIARHGTAEHVERLVRGFRSAKEAEELSRGERQQATRGLTYRYEQDGSLVIQARLPAEIGAMLMKALDAAIDEIAASALRAEAAPRYGVVSASDLPPSLSPELAEGLVATEEARTIKFLPHRVRRADALALLAESFLAHGAAAMSSGDKHQVVVHVDAETLRHGTAGRCHIEDGPAIAAETVRRLACDASLVGILEDAEGDPLNVGRKTRSIPPALRRALNARDKGCRFPGCTHKKYVDHHHIHHWANGGETKASNLVTLCRFHHRIVHEGGVRIEILDDGAFRFVKPDGESLDSIAPGCTQPFDDWRQLAVIHHQQIDSKTAATKWSGEVMDYGLAVEVLLCRKRRGRDVSAETFGGRGGG